MLVVLDGIDGSGKTTLTRKLQQSFGGTYLREPGGTTIGDKVREILINNDMDDVTETLLFIASRRQLFVEILKPLLDAGDLVFLDRFTYSTLAYQHYVRGVDKNLINMLNHRVLEGLKPDITFILHITVDEALRRRGEQTTRFEMREILEKASFAYENIPDVIHIDAQRPLEDVYLELKEKLVQCGLQPL